VTRRREKWKRLRRERDCAYTQKIISNKRLFQTKGYFKQKVVSNKRLFHTKGYFKQKVISNKRIFQTKGYFKQKVISNKRLFQTKGYFKQKVISNKGLFQLRVHTRPIVIREEDVHLSSLRMTWPLLPSIAQHCVATVTTSDGAREDGRVGKEDTCPGWTPSCLMVDGMADGGRVNPFLTENVE
jgi:hypothetical protein